MNVQTLTRSLRLGYSLLISTVGFLGVAATSSHVIFGPSTALNQNRPPFPFRSRSETSLLRSKNCSLHSDPALKLEGCDSEALLRNESEIQGAGKSALNSPDPATFHPMYLN